MGLGVRENDSHLPCARIQVTWWQITFQLLLLFPKPTNHSTSSINSLVLDFSPFPLNDSGTQIRCP